MRTLNPIKELIYASSPRDLDQKLYQMEDTQVDLCLVIEDPRCHVKNFNLPQMAEQKIRQQILFEMVDLLSLPLPDIIMDIKICNQSNGYVNGYYACIPKGAIMEYLQILQKHELSAEFFIPAPLARLAALYKMYTIEKGHTLFLDLSKADEVNIFVFNGNHCELIRKFPYEDPTQTVQEIIRSLMSISAQNGTKKIDQINFYGTTPDTEKFKEILFQQFGVALTTREISLSDLSPVEEKHEFGLNLFKKLRISNKVKKLIHIGANIALMTAVLILIIMRFHMYQNAKSLNKLRESLQPDTKNIVKIVAIKGGTP